MSTDTYGHFGKMQGKILKITLDIPWGGGKGMVKNSNNRDNVVKIAGRRKFKPANYDKVVSQVNEEDEAKILKIIGQKFKAARIEKGYSQIELAEMLGYAGNNAISQIESGLKGMGKKKLLKAAEILGLDPTDLLSSTPYSGRDLKMKMCLEEIIRAGESNPYYQVVEDILKNTAKK